jgi:hypothetical protein
MEPTKIEFLLEKYFEAETTVDEENELKLYFSQANIASHLLQYQPLFGYLKISKEQKLGTKTIIKSQKNYVRILSIAASVFVLLGVGTFCYYNMKVIPSQDLGNFESPEMAFAATQKALSLLSENVNVGISGAEKIQEFDNAKNRVFKN